MYKHAGFRQIANVDREQRAIGRGQLVMPFPGIDVIMQYSSGACFVNDEGTVGYADLILGGISWKYAKSGQTLLTPVIGGIAWDLSINQSKLSRKHVYLFLSILDPDGQYALTIPTIVPEKAIGLWSANNVRLYTLLGEHYRFDNVRFNDVHKMHLESIAGSDVRADGQTLEDLVRVLPEKANEAYKKVFESM